METNNTFQKTQVFNLIILDKSRSDYYDGVDSIMCCSFNPEKRKSERKMMAAQYYNNAATPASQMPQRNTARKTEETVLA